MHSSGKISFLEKNKLFFFLAIAVVPFFSIDSSVSAFIHAFHKEHNAVEPYIKMFVPLVGFLSHGTTLMVGSLLVWQAARRYNRRISDIFRTLLFGLITAGLAAQAIKHLTGRARPRVTDDIVFIGPTFKGSYDSFPSGHSAVLFCLAYILSSSFPRYRVLFYVFAVISALFRLEGPSHFVTDILAGALLGTIVGKVFSETSSKESQQQEASAAIN